MPYNIFNLFFAMYVMPYMGKGPLWNNYEKLVETCNTYWWTNILYINNLYPLNYDDKCLNWTWFLSAYI